MEELLRKAYFVARKLKLEELEKWLNNEQNGYDNSVPEYRKVSGEIKAWNPYHGWIPVIFDARIADVMSKFPMGHSISTMVDLYTSANSSIVLGLNGEITELLNKTTNFIPTKYGYIVSKSELYRVMSTVRNKILDWAIILEENGIIGEDMTFSEEEKKVATTTPTINNYTNNFYGEVNDIGMNQGE